RTRQIERQKDELELQVQQRTVQLTEQQSELETINTELMRQTQWLMEQKSEIERQQEVILAKSRELEDKNEELIRLNEEKNSLVEIVAHDLRSPLASIMSGIRLVRLESELSREE